MLRNELARTLMMEKINRKKQRLQNLLERLDGGEDVCVRDLRNALTTDQFTQYEESWTWHQQTVRGRGGLGIGGSSGYDDFLKKGLFHYNRAECGRFNAAASERARNKAMACFEKALEQLSADIHDDGSVALAYDRPINLTASGNLSLSPAGMPRRLTSKSMDNQIGGITYAQAIKKKRDFKVEAVNNALADFDSHEGTNGQHDTSQDIGMAIKSQVKGLDTQGAKLAKMLGELKKGRKQQ